MMTVNEVSRLTGVSIRTLQYYDKIGLLHPTGYTQANYRLYDDTALEKLQQILLFRELEFPLKDIKTIMESPSFDRNEALEQQIHLLMLKKEHIEKLIDLARGIKKIGVKNMDFSVFNTRKIDEYAKEAKASWGNTVEYQEYEEKAKDRTMEEQQTIHMQMMGIFKEIGSIRGEEPDSPKAQELVKKLQDFITEHFYHCSDQIFVSLGQIYAAGGEMTENIDKVGGEGTGRFVNDAIQIYCAAKQ